MSYARFVQDAVVYELSVTQSLLLNLESVVEWERGWSVQAPVQAEFLVEVGYIKDHHIITNIVQLAPSIFRFFIWVFNQPQITNI